MSTKIHLTSRLPLTTALPSRFPGFRLLFSMWFMLSLPPFTFRVIFPLPEPCLPISSYVKSLLVTQYALFSSTTVNSVIGALFSLQTHLYYIASTQWELEERDWGWDSSVSKESACNAGDLGSIPGSGRSHGEGNGNPLHCACVENPMDRGTWWATVHGVARVRYNLVTKPPPPPRSVPALPWFYAVTEEWGFREDFM